MSSQSKQSLINDLRTARSFFRACLITQALRACKSITPRIVYLTNAWICGVVVIQALSLSFALLDRAYAQPAFPIRATVLEDANLRAGPDTNAARIGGADAGSSLIITGCNAACDWYQTDDGAWIAAFLVQVEISLVQAPPMLLPTPTTPSRLPTPTTLAHKSDRSNTNSSTPASVSSTPMSTISAREPGRNDANVTPTPHPATTPLTAIFSGRLWPPPRKILISLAVFVMGLLLLFLGWKAVRGGSNTSKKVFIFLLLIGILFFITRVGLLYPQQRFDDLGQRDVLFFINQFIQLGVPSNTGLDVMVLVFATILALAFVLFPTGTSRLFFLIVLIPLGVVTVIEFISRFIVIPLVLLILPLVLFIGGGYWLADFMGAAGGLIVLIAVYLLLGKRLGTIWDAIIATNENLPSLSETIMGIIWRFAAKIGNVLGGDVSDEPAPMDGAAGGGVFVAIVIIGVFLFLSNAIFPDLRPYVDFLSLLIFFVMFVVLFVLFLTILPALAKVSEADESYRRSSSEPNHMTATMHMDADTKRAYLEGLAARGRS